MLNNNKKTLSGSVQLYAVLASLICCVKRNKGCLIHQRLLEDGCVLDFLHYLEYILGIQLAFLKKSNQQKTKKKAPQSSAVLWAISMSLWACFSHNSAVCKKW